MLANGAFTCPLVTPECCRLACSSHLTYSGPDSSWKSHTSAYSASTKSVISTVDACCDRVHGSCNLPRKVWHMM